MAEQKIITFMQKASGDGATISEIAESTGIDRRNLYSSLRRLVKAKEVSVCKSSKPQKWSISSVMPSGRSESQHAHVSQKPAKLNLVQQQMVLKYMNQHREPRSALHIAKGIGLRTKKDVNPFLYQLERKNITSHFQKEGGPPLWRLVSDMEPEIFRDTLRDQQAPGAYRRKEEDGLHFAQANRTFSNQGVDNPSGNRGRERGNNRGRGSNSGRGSNRGRSSNRGRGRGSWEAGHNHAQSSPSGSSHHAEIPHHGDSGLENSLSASIGSSCSATAANRDENQPSLMEGNDEEDEWDNDSIDTDVDFNDPVERRYGDLMGQNLYDSELDMMVSYQDDEDGKMMTSYQEDDDGETELLTSVLLEMKSVPNTVANTIRFLADKLQRTEKEIETALTYGKSKNFSIEGGLPCFWRLTKEGEQFLMQVNKDHLTGRDVFSDPQPSSFVTDRAIGSSGSSFSYGGGSGLRMGPPLPPKELTETDPVFAGNPLSSQTVPQFANNFSFPNQSLPAAGIGRGQKVQRAREEYGINQNSRKIIPGLIKVQDLEAVQHADPAVPKMQSQMVSPPRTPILQCYPDRMYMSNVPNDLQSGCSSFDRPQGSFAHEGLIVVRPLLEKRTAATVEFLGHQLDRTDLSGQSRGSPILPCSGPLSLDSATLTKSHSQPVLGSGPMSLPAGDGSAPSLKITSESFAALNKNPISALMEYAQSRHLQARIDVISQKGPSHRPVFAVAAWVGNRQFPVVTCSNKKDGRKEAADVALRTLIAEGQYIAASQSPSINVAPESMTHFDKIAALTHQAFNSLIASIPENLAGRKVIAGLVMKRSEDDIGMVVSIGTGNRCITGDKLSLEGNTVNDSHAEIITRRGFLRFLYQQLKTYQNGKPHDLLEPGSSGKLRVKTGITFHLYISTAPCGDGALFSPRDTESNSGVLLNIDRREHHPTFTSNVQGLLRTKMEGGEGTIPVDSSEITIQTWDGVVRGERLRTMSCTDKICRWNVLGLQGALLSHFLEPIYLDSLTLGFLYDHGHLSRAVCCRLDREAPPLDTCLPAGFYLNHPWLGRVTACQPLRETQKTKAYSINWTVGDTQPEVLDGTLGHCYTAVEKTMFSRLAKRSLYDSFKQVAQHAGRSNLLQFGCYREAKMAAREFQQAKMAMMEKFKKTRCGAWVKKPVEEEMFS